MKWKIEFVLNLKANGIPQGTYKVSLKSDKLEKEYVVLLAKNNRAFKQSLWKFKKKSSYYVTTEKRNLFNKSEKVEGQARELKKYYLKLHKNKKAWRKFYKSWSGNFKHSYANEFASPSKYYFSDWWKELKEIRAELRKESRTINKNINKGAVSTHVLTKQISSISLLQNKITGRRL